MPHYRIGTDFISGIAVGECAHAPDGDGMPWYEGCKLFHWSKDAKLDLLLPVTAVTVMAVVL